MVNIPFGPVGLPVYKRTYARKKKDNTLENYEETIERCLNAAQNQLRVGFTVDEINDFREKLLDLKGFMAGRFMWQLGTETVNRLGFLSLMNCAGVTMDDVIEKMCWLFDISMLGCGVGFNVQREYVYELPLVKKGVKIVHKLTKDADFIVPDSREGWVELLRRILTAYFVTGQGFSYSTICVRGAGEPIKTFGGTASGPAILIEGMEQLCRVVWGRSGKKMRPIDVLDIANIVGSIVVAGNVRRTAEIMLGDVDDTQFLRAKRWDLGNVPNWRAMSNNTLVCNDIKMLPEEYWESFSAGGEVYGLFNLKNAKRFGKAGDTRYPDEGVVTGNPCLEQPLFDYEVCCLAELVLPKFKTKEELLQMAQYLYRVNKHALALPGHIKATEKVVHENMRMGLGVTGYLQATEEQRQWLPDVYEALRNYDAWYSATKGFPQSIKLTTCKPSGTLSKLVGVTEGCHPAYSEYQIQRIRFASNSDMLPSLKEAGYKIEPQVKFDGSIDRTTMVVEFPCYYPNCPTVDKFTAIEQMEVVKRLQKDWSDNAVSVTVGYTVEEVPTIRKYLEENWNEHFKSMSFLMKTGHGFKQAPKEECTKEYYESYISQIKPLNLNKNTSIDEIDASQECSAGVCPIR